MDEGPAHYALFYQLSAAKTLFSKFHFYPGKFGVVRNEDLNTQFCTCTKAIAKFLQVEFLSDWEGEEFEVTMMGKKLGKEQALTFPDISQTTTGHY